MPLDDLRTFLDAPKLTLPIGGRDYVVAPCSAQTFLRLQAVAAQDNDATMPDLELFKLALGEDLFEAMLPNVSSPELRRAGVTAWFWQIGREDAAESFWASGGKAPEAQASTRTRTRRATRTAEANTTRRRGSGSTTTTPRKSSSNAKA